jgi:hypothetical protein
MNQAAGTAEALAESLSSAPTDALPPAEQQTVVTSPTGPSPDTHTSPVGKTWGKGPNKDSTQHVPDDAETSLKAMAAVMEELPSRTAEELDESILDDNAEFIMSRLNHHDSDARKEWTDAMSELIQRVNPMGIMCALQNLKDIFSVTELAGIRAFSLEGGLGPRAVKLPAFLPAGFEQEN